MGRAQQWRELTTKKKESVCLTAVERIKLRSMRRDKVVLSLSGEAI